MHVYTTLTEDQFNRTNVEINLVFYIDANPANARPFALLVE